MKTKKKVVALLEIAIVLCSVFLVATPVIAADQPVQKASVISTASEDDYVLDIYGNANEDDTIDMGDVVYTKLAIFGKKPKTELCDAKYDGRINVLDVIQTKLIILGKEKELTIIDTADRIVTVKKPVERIVVGCVFAVELMRSLNMNKDRIVGVDQSTVLKDIFFLEFSEYPNVGKRSSLDTEKILSLNPDVVFIDAYRMIESPKYDRAIEIFEDGGITVFCFYCYKPESYVEETRKLGYILEKEEEAETFIEFYEGLLITTIKEKVKDIPDDERPRVYIEPYGSKPYKTTGKGSGFHQRIEAAGGNNIFSDHTGFLVVDPEEVIKRDPEIILLRPHGAAGGRPHSAGGYSVDDITALKALRDTIMGRPELANVSAVKNKRVYAIHPTVNSGSSHFIGIAYLAKWFHPNLFEDLDPRAIHQEYLTEFQGLDYDLDKRGVFVYHPEEHPDGH